MAEIKVIPNSIALVDEADLELLIHYKWYLSNGYAINNNRRVKMHRMILNFPDGIVDHRNRNKLDNRRCNLRVVNTCENVHNQTKRINTYNTYKGTYYVARLNLWQSRCRMNKSNYFLGHYKSEIAAAYAYNKKAMELSNCACLNEFDLSVDELENILIKDRAMIKEAEKQSGIKNIKWHSNKRKWDVTIKRKYYGAFTNLEDAINKLNHINESVIQQQII